MLWNEYHRQHLGVWNSFALEVAEIPFYVLFKLVVNNYARGQCLLDGR